MAGQGSYFSRIMVKSVEIMAAAVATTVSGYLIAHFSGYLTSPMSLPAAVQVAPSTATSGASASRPARPVQTSVSPQPIVPASADAAPPRSAPAQDVTPPQPARSTTNAAPVVTPRKRAVTDTNAAETRSRDPETVESRVRAALAKVDSTRPVQPAVPPRQADVMPGPPAVAPPRATDNAPGPVAVAPHAVDTNAAVNPPRAVDPVTVGAVPRAADPLPPPAQVAPAQSEPLTTVEIKSRPIASVDASPPPQPAPPAEEEEDKGLLSAIKKIPDFLRSDSHPPVTEAPRPPMPVGD